MQTRLPPCGRDDAAVTVRWLSVLGSLGSWDVLQKGGKQRCLHRSIPQLGEHLATLLYKPGANVGENNPDEILVAKSPGENHVLRWLKCLQDQHDHRRALEW